jgi:rhodanese-related sulfurtransferase
MSSKSIFLSLFFIASRTWSFTTITPAIVHERLVRGDSLILLDVREVSEYQRGHIAEPSGQLPLTPANMPYSSSVLTQEYTRLPKTMDIVVYCASGARSAAASAFLDAKGFTRIFNMSGGFSGWTYESRKEGFGDHSGKWLRPTDRNATTIFTISNGDSSKLYLAAGSLSGTDSIYFEIHHANNKSFVPANVPASDLDGLFRITALNRFGLSVWTSDSLQLAVTAQLSLVPEYKAGQKTALLNGLGMTCFTPTQNWQALAFRMNGLAFSASERSLKKWYNLYGFVVTAVAHQLQITSPPAIALYPNPFNDSIRIEAPDHAEINVYDSAGRFVEKIRAGLWQPAASSPTGIYFVHVRLNQQNVIAKVTHIK